MNTTNNSMEEPHKYNAAQEKQTLKNAKRMACSHQVWKWSKLMGSREVRKAVIQIGRVVQGVQEKFVGELQRVDDILLSVLHGGSPDGFYFMKN